MAEAIRSAAVEDVARSASGELVDACTGARHHVSTIIDLAIKEHMTRDGYWPLGGGTYLAQGEPVRIQGASAREGLEIHMGVEMGLSRCEAGLCLAVDLTAKASVRSGALDTVADLIVAVFGERGPRTPEEVLQLKQLLNRKMVTIIRPGQPDETAKISRRNFRGATGGVLVATSARDATFERIAPPPTASLTTAAPPALPARERISVAVYQEGKGHPLLYPHLPVVRIDAGYEWETVVGEDGARSRRPKRDAAGKKIEKITEIPAERLRIELGQRARGINMAEQMIKVLSVRPHKRYAKIVDHVSRSRLAASQSLAAIGLRLAPRPLAVVAKIFDLPILVERGLNGVFRRLYMPDGKHGEWKSNNEVFRVATAELRHVMLIDMGGGRAPPTTLRAYVDNLCGACREIGIRLDAPAAPVRVRSGAALSAVYDAVSGACASARIDTPHVILVVIRKSMASISESDYGAIKRFEHETGIMTSCVTAETLNDAFGGKRGGFMPIARSIAAKINAKFGGVNRAVCTAMPVDDRGADDGSAPEDLNPWTGEVPTALVSVHVALAGAYDAAVPSIVTAACTVNRLMTEYRFASRIAPADARLDEDLAQVIGEAVCDVLGQFNTLPARFRSASSCSARARSPAKTIAGCWSWSRRPSRTGCDRSPASRCC